MRVDLHAVVRTRDGEDAGDVQRAVFDPQTGDVTGFVINSGTFLGRDILVPRTEVERGSEDGGAIRLRLTKAELRELAPFVPADYAPPPAGWSPPAASGFAEGAFLWPGGYLYGPGFTGVTAPAAGSVHGGTVTTLEAGARGTHSDSPTVGKGDKVLDVDGEDVGTIDDVRFDEASGALRGVVARVGGRLSALFGGGETVEISASQIDEVEEGAVRLSVRKEDAGDERN